MAEDKQWFWTKFVGSVLSLMLILSIAVGATNMHYNLSDKVERNTEDIGEHKADDEKKWDNIHEDVDENSTAINELKLQGAKSEAQYAEIMRVLHEMKATIDRLEYAGGE